MQKPKQSLDDFINYAAPQPPEPPAIRSPRLTGDTIDLKPLARAEDLNEDLLCTGDKTLQSRFVDQVNGLSKLRLSLVFGTVIGAALLILGAVVYLGLIGKPTSAELEDNESALRHAEGTRRPPKVMGLFEIGLAKRTPTVTAGPDVDEPDNGRRPARTKLGLISYKRALRHSPRTKLRVSNFVPTTLIIYAENGKIKTRIEPQLTAAYKKTAQLPN